MSFDDLMTYINIRVPDLVAGASGGVVKALIFHRDRPVETIFSGIIGGLTANYLGEFLFFKVQEYGMQRIGMGAVCFVVGLTAMVICQAAIDLVRRWKGSTDESKRD